jgi:hypothetical protein
VGVSATIGKGFDKLMPTFDQLKKEYFEVFLPELTEQESSEDQKADSM